MHLTLKTWGRIGVAAHALGAAKYVAHRVPDKRWDKAFLKLHFVAALAMPVAAGIHTAQAFRSGKVTLAKAVTGAVIDAGVAGLIASHVCSTPLGSKAMPMHRAATVVSGAGILAHCLCKH